MPALTGPGPKVSTALAPKTEIQRRGGGLPVTMMGTRLKCKQEHTLRKYIPGSPLRTRSRRDRARPGTDTPTTRCPPPPDRSTPEQPGAHKPTSRHCHHLHRRQTPELQLCVLPLLGSDAYELWFDGACRTHTITNESDRRAPPSTRLIHVAVPRDLSTMGSSDRVTRWESPSLAALKEQPAEVHQYMRRTVKTLCGPIRLAGVAHDKWRWSGLGWQAGGDTSEWWQAEAGVSEWWRFVDGMPSTPRGRRGWGKDSAGSLPMKVRASGGSGSTGGPTSGVGFGGSCNMSPNLRCAHGHMQANTARRASLGQTSGPGEPNDIGAHSNMFAQ